MIKQDQLKVCVIKQELECWLKCFLTVLWLFYSISLLLSKLRHKTEEEIWALSLTLMSSVNDHLKWRSAATGPDVVLLILPCSGASVSVPTVKLWLK